MKSVVSLAKDMLPFAIWSSSNIEGFGTSLGKTKAILNGVYNGASREEVLFISNMKKAWDFLLGNIGCCNNLMLLREFNKICGSGGLIYDAGEIRSVDVAMGGTSWKPKLPDVASIYEEVERLNSVENPEIRALRYFCFVARTQMFLDGNKRVAQLIANKILIENNVGIFLVPINLIDYFSELMVRFYESDNGTEFIRFMHEYCVNRV